METEFTPWLSLAGGLLIGLAATLLMLHRGRIFGATGILAGIVVPDTSSDWAWRAVLLAGMISGPLAVLAVTGQMPAVDAPVSLPVLIVSGFVVGIGVTFGGGCTSGHGVCGMARLSPRSVVAVVLFLATAAATVYVTRHLAGGA